MKQHRKWVPCAGCGRMERPSALTECMHCLRLFHSSCMQRARKRNKAKGYWLCPDCYDLRASKGEISPPRNGRRGDEEMKPMDWAIRQSQSRAKCWAYKEDGTLCGRPAVGVDPERGIAVCQRHFKGDERPKLHINVPQH